MPTYVRYQGNGRCTVSCLTIKRRANRMLRVMHRADAELSVLLCDDATIRGLNRLYRGNRRVTDVLSFSMIEGDPVSAPYLLLGDIVISLPRAAAQAAARNRTLLHEVTVLLAHGLLHLLGFGHQTGASERRMLEQTRKLVETARQGRRIDRSTG